MEQFLTLINTKNFVLRCHPSLTVQEVEIAENMRMGRNSWVLLCLWSLKVN